MPTTLIRLEFRRNTAAQWTAGNEVLLAGEPGFETDTMKWKLGDGSAPWNALTYQGPVTVNAADPRFGTTRDQAQINNAINYVKQFGGGKVTVRRLDGPWTIRRRITGDQKSGGIWIDSSNITLESDGAALTCADNCDFIRVQSTLGGQVTITANTAITDTTVTVASSATFTIGQTVFLRLGQASYDAFEPDFWLYAKVAAIPDGTHVTLDRPLGYALDVTATTAPAQKSIAPVPTLVENIAIDGTWNLINPASPGAVAEAGVSIQYGRNFRVGTIIATTPGSGAILAQFVDTMVVDTLRVPTSHAQNGASAKGRGVTLAECRGVHINTIDIDDFERSVIVAEGRTGGVTVDSVIARNTYTGRNPSNVALITALGNSRVDVGVFYVEGFGSYVTDNGGTAGTSVTIQDAYFYTSTRPNFADLNVVRRRLYADGKLFTDRRTVTRRINLTANMAGATTTLPAGQFIETGIYVSTLTGVTDVYLGASGNNNISVGATLVADRTVYPAQGRGFGGPYTPSIDTSKKVIVYTGATLPTGAFLVIRAVYFADPAGSDPQIQF